jgi:TonB-dependent SusC/RagA subfamily outer membrane receptor
MNKSNSDIMKPGYVLFLIFSLLLSTTSFGQKPSKKLTITGVVRDVNQKPVSGVFIFIDNQKTNTVTDDKGFYKIKVSPKARSISAFTLKNGVSETEIGGRIMINFSLKGSATSGKTEIGNTRDDETVNVGYGTMKKKDLTTSVGKIDGTNKKYASYQNIYDMIRGEIPGVQVTGKSIMIQGPSSINLSTEPLFVVDGVTVTSIDEISPQMVKSIEVLKGASASIYGSRGANGVILIYLLGAPERKK